MEFQRMHGERIRSARHRKMEMSFLCETKDETAAWVETDSRGGRRRAGQGRRQAELGSRRGCMLWDAERL